MAYAIIEESGGQRRVQQGDAILIDLVNQGEAKEGDTITVDKVLVVGEPGGSAKIGAPYVPGATVTLQITEPVVMGDKIVIRKFRTKNTYERKTGHRQRYTGATVQSINA